MGGFLGPLGAMSGFAANTRLQGQREAQLQAINQLKMSGLLQEQQGGALQLQQAQSEFAARQKIIQDPNTPPEVKMALSLGANPADVVKMQTEEKQDRIESLLLGTPDMAQRQKIWSTAQELDPSLTITPTIAKILGVGMTAEQLEYYKLRNQNLKATTAQKELINKLLGNPATQALALKLIESGAGGPDITGAGGGAAPEDLEPVGP